MNKLLFILLSAVMAIQNPISAGSQKTNKSKSKKIKKNSKKNAKKTKKGGVVAYSTTAPKTTPSPEPIKKDSKKPFESFFETVNELKKDYDNEVAKKTIEKHLHTAKKYNEIIVKLQEEKNKIVKLQEEKNKAEMKTYDKKTALKDFEEIANKLSELTNNCKEENKNDNQKYKGLIEKYNEATKNDFQQDTLKNLELANIKTINLRITTNQYLIEKCTILNKAISLLSQDIRIEKQKEDLIKNKETRITRQEETNKKNLETKMTKETSYTEQKYKDDFKHRSLNTEKSTERTAEEIKAAKKEREDAIAKIKKTTDYLSLSLANKINMLQEIKDDLAVNKDEAKNTKAKEWFEQYKISLEKYNIKNEIQFYILLTLETIDQTIGNNKKRSIIDLVIKNIENAGEKQILIERLKAIKEKSQDNSTFKKIIEELIKTIEAFDTEKKDPSNKNKQRKEIYNIISSIEENNFKDFFNAKKVIEEQNKKEEAQPNKIANEEQLIENLEQKEIAEKINEEEKTENNNKELREMQNQKEENKKEN